MAFYNNDFNEEGEVQIQLLENYLRRLYSITTCEINSFYFGDDYIIEIKERNRLVNKYILTPGYNGKIETLKILGMNLQVYLNRFVNERKVFMFDAINCERDGWDEYIEFTLA